MAEPSSEFSIHSDEELMSFVRQGEVRAFDELYVRYGGRLLAYFTRMLNFNRTQAEDALQDLFLKIAEAPEKFDTNRSFRTWIFSIASNTCKNYYRHRQVVAQSREEIAYEGEWKDNSAFVNCASRIDARLFRNMLEECLNELPPEKKEAFILKYQEEKTIAEIAEIQNCPEGSVKSRLYYTIRLLEEKLKLFNPVCE